MRHQAKVRALGRGLRGVLQLREFCAGLQPRCRSCQASHCAHKTADGERDARSQARVAARTRVDHELDSDVSQPSPDRCLSFRTHGPRRCRRDVKASTEDAGEPLSAGACTHAQRSEERAAVEAANPPRGARGRANSSKKQRKSLNGTRPRHARGEDWGDRGRRRRWRTDTARGDWTRLALQMETRGRASPIAGN